jgi:hypothetical protein
MKNTNRMISPELVKAYCDASYVIYGEDGDIQLRVNQPCLELTALMRKHGVRSAALLTAFNPHSILSTTETNVRNHNALIGDLQSLGLKSISGEGEDPSKLWPSEPSVLVLGIPLPSAELLADRYGQNGYLWIASDDGVVNLNLRYPIGGPS